MIRYSVLAFLLYFALSAAISNAQADDQSGYISIDCGLARNSTYVDLVTGIYYTSDSGFTDNGVSKTISPVYNINSLEQQYLNVRSFPQGTRNCYTLRPVQGKGGKYLIRASFMYGNYDGENQLPMFDLHLGVGYWDTITFFNTSTPYQTEVIHIALSDYINVCLVKTGPTTPFISTLELRTLKKDSYPTEFGSLKFFDRKKFNPLLSSTNHVIRYKDDLYDRIWGYLTLFNTTTLINITSLTDTSESTYKLPLAAMTTACLATNSSGDTLKFKWTAGNATDKFYVYMHFAELQDLEKLNQSRKFNIYINDEEWHTLYSPIYQLPSTIYSGQGISGYTEYNVVINKTADSTLPPVISAVELYTVIDLSLPDTYDGDVVAMQSIKSTYAITKNWQGDPCWPRDFEWDGVTCIKDDFDPPRIISLNLSSSGLDGTIAPSISNLTLLQTLDLSNNNLNGKVPDFLAQMASLKELNLKGNNFTRPFPTQLLEKADKGKIKLSFDAANSTDGSCQSDSCKKNKKSVVVPVVASVAAVLFVVFAVVIAFFVIRMRKRKAITNVNNVELNKQGGVESGNMQFSGKSNDMMETTSSSNTNNNDYNIVASKSRQFTYHEVLGMTNNFQRVIGKGGFGIVYHGYVGNTQVAVKMLSQSSTQGYKEFQAEANLLLTIHHKNLTSLVGYCYEGTNMGIIYEYMPNGNLEKHLLGKGPYVLTWEERLRIAIDAAQGLEYLHHGCIPPVVHRDVKTSNILLDEKFRAKLADFGLSRAFPVDNGTHVSTIVAGTPGYLDPEYYSTTRLTEKSDVYSFGVVLFEIVSGRSALPRNNETHIITWISSELENGDVRSITDPRLRGDYSVNSVWKFVEVAMACVARSSAKRPTMNHVVMELKACLAAEMTRNETESRDSVGVIPMSLDTRLGPLAR